MEWLLVAQSGRSKHKGQLVSDQCAQEFGQFATDKGLTQLDSVP
jgi:hypothetical protein